MKLKILTASISLILALQSFCCSFDGNEVSSGTLIPTTVYQTTTNVIDGNYYSVNVTCGNTYNFNFCNNGGSASWDTQITILATDGTTELAYDDDACSTQSDISWTADFTGTVYILITEYNCNLDRVESPAIMSYNMTVGTTDPSFNLSVSCGGGISTVTGTPGGTFAFNPTPGDGAQINATTGTVSNGSAGTTYFVEYTTCSNSSIESVTVVDEDCFTLNGSGQYINVAGEQCIQLTDEINSQTGCAWNGSQIDFNSSFSLSLDYYFGDNINGADGNTFTFQPSSSTACGQDGTQLGAGGIPNALVIEFDTYDNGTNDMVCDHIAVEIDGNVQNGTPYCGPVCAKSGGGNIDDGGTYSVEIAWDAVTEQLEIYFDGALRLSCSGDFVNTVFGGQNMAYWGATSATGGFNNQQYFCPSTVIILPTELGSFTTTCLEGYELIEWTTLSEYRVDYYQLEYTYDGMIFYPIEKIKAVGSSDSPTKYSVENFDNDHQQRYYRLKMVDENGDLEYTDIISGKLCNNSKDLISSIKQSGSTLQIECSNATNITVIDYLGKVIFESMEYKTEFLFDAKILSKGVYYLIAKDELGKIESKKILATN